MKCVPRWAAQFLAFFMFPAFLVLVCVESTGTDWGWFIREFSPKGVLNILWNSLVGRPPEVQVLQGIKR